MEPTKEIILVLEKRAQTWHVPFEALESLYILQNGKCAICRAEFFPSNIFVDHDHVISPAYAGIRGFLCSHCNTRLGMVEHFVESASKYLREYPATQVMWLSDARGRSKVRRLTEEGKMSNRELRRSPEYRARLSEAAKRAWADPNHALNRLGRKP